MNFLRPYLAISPVGTTEPKQHSIIVKALAKALRWQKMLDTGKCSSIRELAERKAIIPSYIARILCLNLLAPDIKQAILDGKLPWEVNLQQLLEGFPDVWEEQRGWLVK